jgi:hypothetical protein
MRREFGELASIMRYLRIADFPRTVSMTCLAWALLAPLPACAQLFPGVPAPDQGTAPGDAPGTLVQTITLPEKLSPAKVREAIVRSAMGRKWTIVKADDTRVQLRLADDGIEANLVALIEPAAIKIFSDSYRINREGERRGSLVPERWLKYLTRDIEKRLAEAAYLG